jgi:hypothetical protein
VETEVVEPPLPLVMKAGQRKSKAYLVLPRLGTTNMIVKKAIAPVEIENKYQISSLEDDHLIFLMFP